MPDVQQVDASIPLKAAPPTFDPMATIGRLQSVQQGILQNRLLGQQVKGKEVLGSIIGGATGPNGKTDWDLVSSRAAQTPEAAILLPDIQKASLERQIADLQRKREELGLTKDQGKFLAGGMVPFIQRFSTVDPATGKAPTPTRGDFQEALINTLGAMGPSVDENVAKRAAALLQNAPEDPAALMQTVRGLVLLGDPTPETVTMLMGAPAALNTGPATVYTRTPPIGGPTTVAGGVQMGLTPQDKTALISVVGPDKQTYAVPKGAMFDAYGNPLPAEGGPAMPAGAPRGAVAVTGLAPGVTRGMEASSEAWQRDLTEAGSFAQRVFGLDKALTALQVAPTGKGSKPFQDWRNVLMTIGVPLSASEQAKTISQAEAEKYLQDYANRKGASLGMGTDTARAMVNAANPGINTPNAAAQSVLKANIGLERLQAAQVAAAQSEGIGSRPGAYNDWRATWNRSVDPIGFMADLMTEDERVKYRDSLPSEAAKDRYRKAVKAAIAAGQFTAEDLRKK